MIRIAWEPAFNVQVRIMDAQHKRLVAFMNEVYERLEEDSCASACDDFFKKLTKHAQHHFETEERYFAAFKYPDAAKHIKEHDKIRAKIRELEKEFDANPSVTVVFETLRFLDDWLFDHVMMFDKKYTDHFKKHGLK